MKILFLDHDGVICLATEWGSRFKNKEKFDRFNEKAVKILNKIIKETDCEIVVSSDWKNHVTLEQMQELYKIRGILKSPIDYTPDADYSDDFKWSREYEYEQSRCLEIKTWLKNHPDVTNWVAVDDMSLSNKYYFEYDKYRGEWGLENFVHTPLHNEGIKQSSVKDKIIKILNGE
jgi:hypothetical protein